MFFLIFYVKNLMINREQSMKEVKILTKDNIDIAINHYENGFDRVVIIAPGWFMTKDSKYFKQICEIFIKKSDIIAMDFRGHGKSSGYYTFTSKEINDITSVIDYAKEKYKKIYLIGFSLGAAIALIAASQVEEIDKVIAISAPISFEKIENKMWRKEAWLPTIKKFELERWFSIRPDLINRKKIKPIDIIDKVKCPTLFVAGENDQIVCSWHTKTLFDKAQCIKKYEFFEKCYHAEDLFIQDKEKFIKMCINWLFDE